MEKVKSVFKKKSSKKDPNKKKDSPKESQSKSKSNGANVNNAENPNCRSEASNIGIATPQQPNQDSDLVTQTGPETAKSILSDSQLEIQEPSRDEASNNHGNIDEPMNQLQLEDGQTETQSQENISVQPMQQANQPQAIEDVSQNQQITGVSDVQPQELVRHSENGENRENVSVEEAAATILPEVPLVSDLVNNKKVIDHLSLLLNRNSLTVNTWENLAHELHAPQHVIALCKRSTQHSPTESLFETLSSSHLTRNLTVSKLIDQLSSLGRNDVVNLLEQNITADQRTLEISEVVLSNVELMEQLSTLLDKESRTVRNWYYLGLRLGLSKEILHEIKNGNNPSCVAELFDYIYKTFPSLTVEKFKEIMVKINRKDVIDRLIEINSGKMKEKVHLNSDLMTLICYDLNKNSCGAVKDWKHLAVELGIEHDKYKNFEKEISDGPTEVLLDWAVGARPKLTVKDLCMKLKTIRRYDAIEAVEKTYGQSFS